MVAGIVARGAMVFGRLSLMPIGRKGKTMFLRLARLWMAGVVLAFVALVVGAVVGAVVVGADGPTDGRDYQTVVPVGAIWPVGQSARFALAGESVIVLNGDSLDASAFERVLIRGRLYRVASTRFDDGYRLWIVTLAGPLSDGLGEGETVLGTWPGKG